MGLRVKDGKTHALQGSGAMRHPASFWLLGAWHPVSFSLILSTAALLRILTLPRNHKCPQSGLGCLLEPVVGFWLKGVSFIFVGEKKKGEVTL